MIKFLVLLICVLLRIAFITLFERKVLRFAQIRKGPNVVGRWGILQPFTDGVKLLSKESLRPNLSNLISSLGPIYTFLLMLSIWLPMFEAINVSFGNGLIFILLIRSLAGFLILLVG